MLALDSRSVRFGGLLEDSDVATVAMLNGDDGARAFFAAGGTISSSFSF
jgi:hypothetical protein